MAQAFPYTYICCPCSEINRRRAIPKRYSRENDLEEDGNDEDEKTFDPRHSRSSFSLFPPEHLLYCEECHDIKCPRCVTEEVICWYCPSCLFETPSSTVRSEGNRCARNCFNCPICTSQLVTLSMTDAKEGPFYLSCNYCMWTTLDIGIKFEKPSNIRAQLDKIENGGKLKPNRKMTGLQEPARTSSLSREPLSPANMQEDANPLELTQPNTSMDAIAQFGALKAFYKDQLAKSSTTDPSMPGADFTFSSSPSSLARIMNMYSTNLGNQIKKPRQKPIVMREALSPSEGLLVTNSEDAAKAISKLQSSDFINTTNPKQRLSQQVPSIGNPNARFVDDLRPIPTQLRTKRNKRCKECKHILVKPELKVTSTRYRIKLVALNYIPLISLKPLPGNPSKDFVITAAKPSQWILTLKNHLFDSVNVSLGTPSLTPGRYAHRVTILCPQFEVGANSDVWNDALNADPAKAMLNPSGGGGGEQIAGKIYDQGRNWTSVVLEIVPANVVRSGDDDDNQQEEEEEEQEDDDVVEVPIRVRLEWRHTDASGEKEKKSSSSEKAMEEDADEGKRELAYWMVLGVGRVARTSSTNS